MKPIDFALACEVESNLTMELEVEFQDEVHCEDFLNLNETLYFLYASGWRLMGLSMLSRYVENDD
jgi:hypothetical protein